MFSLTPVVKNLLWANILLFIMMFLSKSMIGTMALWNINSDHFRIWQPITHQFLHGSLMHILFNMLAFISLGTFCERFFGGTRFLIYYLLCGVFAGFFHMLITNSNIPMIGASGAVFGVLSMFSLIYPNDKLSLFFIINIKAKYLTSSIILIEIILALFSNDYLVAHWAHVGGAMMGLFLFLLNKFIK